MLIASVHFEDLQDYFLGGTAFFRLDSRLQDYLDLAISLFSCFTHPLKTNVNSASVRKMLKKLNPEDDSLGGAPMNPQQHGHVWEIQPTIFWGPNGLTHATMMHPSYINARKPAQRFDMFWSFFMFSLCFCLLKTWELPHVYRHFAPQFYWDLWKMCVLLQWELKKC